MNNRVIDLSRLIRTPRYYDNTFAAGALTLRKVAYLCVDIVETLIPTGSPGKTPRLCSYSAFRECRLIYVVAGFPASAMLTPRCVRAGDGPPVSKFNVRFFHGVFISSLSVRRLNVC